MFVGAVDWGTRYALMRKWLGGLHQMEGLVNIDIWRHWAPIVFSSLVTSVIAPPLEVAERAYIGDKTFPEHLRYKFTSRFNALWRIALTQPYALYKNSGPSIAASFVQTSMAFSIFDYLLDLFSPIVCASGSPHGSIKFV